jgi:hypothetical protein
MKITTPKFFSSTISFDKLEFLKILSFFIDAKAFAEMQSAHPSGVAVQITIRL